MNVDQAIAEVLDEHGDLPVPVIAGKVRAKLEEDDAGALEDWLHENLEILIALSVRRVRRKRRADEPRDDGPKKRFTIAAQSGDKELLAEFLTFRDEATVREDGTVKDVADFNADDHLYVAGTYQQRGQTALMLAAFHRQVAKLVGHRRTSDVMSEDAYAALHDRLRRRMSN